MSSELEQVKRPNPWKTTTTTTMMRKLFVDNEVVGQVS